MQSEVKYSKNTITLLLVNFITLLRIPLTIVFAYELINYLKTGQSLFGLSSIIISLLIIFSDFIDGKLARKYDVTSKIGQILDVHLDFIYIMVSTSILALYNKLDLYFVVVIVYKFLEFIITSKIFKGRFKNKKSENFYYDNLGTIASGMYYIIPLIVICLLYFKIKYIKIIISIIEIVATSLTFIATYVKFIK